MYAYIYIYDNDNDNIYYYHYYYYYYHVVRKLAASSPPQQKRGLDSRRVLVLRADFHAKNYRTDIIRGKQPTRRQHIQV